MIEPGKPLHHHISDYFFPHPRNNYRPHIFSYASIIAIAITIIVAEIGYVTQTKYVFLNTDFLAAVLPSVLADLTNVARADSGLTQVTRSPILDKAAEDAAQDMATKGYFSHVAPDGTTPWHWLDQEGYAYSYAGQNLAVNFTDSENVQTAWLASPTHRENIMKPQYTEVGFGTATGTYQGQETTFVVEYFATPAIVAAKPARSAGTGTKKIIPVALAPSVLGAESSNHATSSASTSNIVAVPPAAGTEEVGQTEVKAYQRLLVSPFTTLEGILTAFLTIIFLAFGLALVLKGKMQHPSVVYGGAFLMLLISVALLGTMALTDPVMLSPAAVHVASASIGL